MYKKRMGLVIHSRSCSRFSEQRLLITLVQRLTALNYKLKKGQSCKTKYLNVVVLIYY